MLVSVPDLETIPLESRHLLPMENTHLTEPTDTGNKNQQQEVCDHIWEFIDIQQRSADESCAIMQRCTKCLFVNKLIR